MTADELSAELASLGLPAFRARQVAKWIWAKGVYEFSAMTDLPGALREQLAERLTILAGRVAARSDAPDGVIKLLIEWPDGERIETVLIPAAGRATACVSTQVGCSMRCGFCASGYGGLVRNLSAGEIVEQIAQLQQATGERVSHVVVMGMGEPLANYDATVAAVRAIIDPDRLGISARRVTISTVGLPGPIRRLAGEGLPVTLAISLHAPNDPLRQRLMPAAAKFPLEKVLSAAEEFRRSRNRRLTVEYVLLPGVNDTSVCAAALARIARRLEANVNLIRFNPNESAPYRRPTQAEVKAFADRLRAGGANVQVRRSRGLEADAACGQLRRRADVDRPPAGTDNT